MILIGCNNLITYPSTNLFAAIDINVRENLHERHTFSRTWVTSTIRLPDNTRRHAILNTHRTNRKEPTTLKLRTRDMRRSHDPRVIRLPWISPLLFFNPSRRKSLSRENSDTRPLTCSTRQRCRLLIFLLYRQFPERWLHVKRKMRYEK